MNKNLMKSKTSVMHRKKSPDKFLKAFEEALSYFPELHDVFILVQETPFFGVQHTLRSYPPLTVLHWPRSKWVYPIVVNKNKDVNISFYNLTFKQQVGSLMHELAHTSYYVNLDRRDMLLFSIKYAFSKEFVRKLEKKADLKVVEKGGGVDLVLERIFSLDWRADNPYPEIKDTYILPNDLIENLKKYPDLYSKKEIQMCIYKLEKVKNKIKIIRLPLHISILRKITHSVKTIFGFFPGFILMFYIITIKKTHLK